MYRLFQTSRVPGRPIYWLASPPDYTTGLGWQGITTFTSVKEAKAWVRKVSKGKTKVKY